MNLPKNIIDSLAFFLETEIQAGRRLAPLNDEAVVSFLAIPEHEKQRVKAAPRTQNTPPPAKLEFLPPTPLPTPEPPPIQTLEEIAEAVASCERCDLHKTRSKSVPGDGRPNRPDILFINEKPENENKKDADGQPIIGEAEQLLTNMISAMGYSRQEIFITSSVKCHAPSNQKPKLGEVKACLPWLRNQIRLIQPACIVTLGDAALRGLENNPRLDVNKEHGIWRKFEGIPVMPTLHLDELIRHKTAKRTAWEDLKIVLKHLGKTPPKPATKKSPKT